MADEGIKKVRIPIEEFPLLQFTTIVNEGREEIDSLYYDFRYRIASEDKNRFSHWSPIQRKVHPDLGSYVFFKVDEEVSVYPYPDKMAIASSGTPLNVNASWTPPTAPENLFEDAINRKRVYDVWVRWNNSKTTSESASGWSNWEYVTRVSSNNFSILKGNPARQSVDIAIQLPTEVKLRDYNNNKLTLFRQISDTI